LVRLNKLQRRQAIDAV